MTQDGLSSAATRVSPRSNVYTVLMIVAALALCVGVAAIWVRSAQLFRSSNPLELPRTAANR